MSDIYLQLFNGRNTPDQAMEDWGTSGPIFGPLTHVQQTYGLDIKANYAKKSKNAIDIQMDIVDGCVYYDGVYYGDYTVFSHNKERDGEMKDSVKSMIEKFDPDKAGFMENEGWNRKKNLTS